LNCEWKVFITPNRSIYHSK